MRCMLAAGKTARASPPDSAPADARVLPGGGAQGILAAEGKEAAMEYGRLLTDAFEITWRHRFLWVLGLFAGSSTCSGSFNSQWPTGTDFSRGAPGGGDF